MELNLIILSIVLLIIIIISNYFNNYENFELTNNENSFNFNSPKH